MPVEPTLAKETQTETGVQTRTQSVTDRIREHIIEGQMTAGEHLREKRLAELFGVSRTPIRDALNVLSSEGLLEYAPNRGYVVRNFSSKDILAAYQLRAELEALACRICATDGISKKIADTLLNCLEDGDAILMKGELLDEDLALYRSMNDTLHQTILSAAGNHWITTAVKITQNIPYASSRSIVWNDYSVIVRAHDDHHRTVDTILRRDPVRAEGLMREHVVYAGQVLALYSQNRNQRFSVAKARINPLRKTESVRSSPTFSR